jgi:hypothetical protein
MKLRSFSSNSTENSIAPFPLHWTRLEFQPRDLNFLRILLEQKFLSREQLVNFIFDGKKRYAYLRLWKLRRFDFVKRVLGFVPDGLYLPTQKTYDYFKSRFVEVPAPVACPDPRTIFHDLLVTDIRFLFNRIGFGSSWTSERVWRMGRSVRLWAPDAVIQVGGDSFAVEVERVQKESVRYEDIFARYQNDPELTACLYMTGENLLPLLLEKAEGYPAVYFTTLAELFEKKERAVFRNAKGSVLEIEENLERNLEAGRR